jgi:hypothetical protein
MAPEDDPDEDTQPTREEWEEYERTALVYCHACSVAGGADRPVYHLGPPCPADPPTPTKGIDP